MLHDGDIVFRMGDARTLSDLFPFSRFLAGASGSRFSHTGIVAIEDGAPVVYDCTKPSVGRIPFAVWVSDNIGAFGVKRLKAERRRAIPDLAFFHRFVREIFFHRRKFLRGVAVSAFKNELSKADVDEVLASQHLGPTARTEELSVERLLALCEAFRGKLANTTARR